MIANGSWIAVHLQGPRTCSLNDPRFFSTMPELHEYLLFIAAGLLLNVTPGADMLYVITSAARHGVGRGVAGAFGVFAGILVHITLAAVGLSAVLAASPL